MAQKKVKRSPMLNSEPLGRVKRYSPLTANITPIKGNILIFSFNIRNESGGIMTTNKPVIKADLEAAVYFSPKV